MSSLCAILNWLVEQQRLFGGQRVHVSQKLFGFVRIKK